MRRFADKMVRMLASRKFFVFIIVLLIFQALWLALSFNYPMLWDEYYHFGLIQFYSHHISPIITSQPHSLDLYGNVSRSPKYLYHYLMSFPLRGISLFTADQTIQIIALRIINIGLFAGGLVAFRQAMLRMTKSKALVHFVLLILVLLPLSSLLAAQINYDNLQFLLTGLVLYWTLRFLQAKRLEIHWLLLALGVGLLTCVVKYTFLPILLAVVLVAGYQLWHRYGRAVPGAAWQSFRRLGKWNMLGLSLLVLIGLGLCGERFGVNLVRYHTIDPECSKVMSVERCLNFSPFKQEYTFHESKLAGTTPQPGGPFYFVYHEWFRQLYEQYFTTGTQTASEQYEISSAFKIPFITMLVAGAIGLICFIIYAPKLWHRYDIWLAVLSAVALAAALWLVDFAKYRKTGLPLAIQGRYLLPVVPLGMLLGAIAANRVLRWRNIRIVLATLTILGIFWGGGLFTHIILSPSYWYWPNHTVIDVNQSITNALKPIFF